MRSSQLRSSSLNWRNCSLLRRVIFSHHNPGWLILPLPLDYGYTHANRPTSTELQLTLAMHCCIRRFAPICRGIDRRADLPGLRQSANRRPAGGLSYCRELTARTSGYDGCFFSRSSHNSRYLRFQSIKKRREMIMPTPIAIQMTSPRRPAR